LTGLQPALAGGAVEVVDLTHTLDPDFPVIVLPPEFGQCARFRMEEVSAYDGRGPAWKWHNISMNEHTGTHFDAPIHWVSGRDVPNGAVDEIPPSVFVGPVCVIDCSEGAARNDDFELTPEIIEAWEAEHGPIPADSLGADAHRLVEAQRRGLSQHGRRRTAFTGPTPEAIRHCSSATSAASAPKRLAPMRGRGRITCRPIRRTICCTGPGATGCSALPISTGCHPPVRC
jgi:kynurenine formamidase